MKTCYLLLSNDNRVNKHSHDFIAGFLLKGESKIISDIPVLPSLQKNPKKQSTTVVFLLVCPSLGRKHCRLVFVFFRIFREEEN